MKDYLQYIASIKGIRPSLAGKRIEELLHQVGMNKERHKKMKKLSGGTKRRVDIAQAMLNDPKILVLDEPTAGLDPNKRIRFRNLISELSQDRLVLLYTGIILTALSAGGGNCPIQAGFHGWKSFYNITFFQEHLLTAFGGYIGTLFILITVMLVSAATKSAVIAVAFPVVVLFLPTFIGGLSSVSGVLGLLPVLYWTYRGTEVYGAI